MNAIVDCIFANLKTFKLIICATSNIIPYFQLAIILWAIKWTFQHYELKIISGFPNTSASLLSLRSVFIKSRWKSTHIIKYLLPRAKYFSIFIRKIELVFIDFQILVPDSDPKPLKIL